MIYVICDISMESHSSNIYDILINTHIATQQKQKFYVNFEMHTLDFKWIYAGRFNIQKYQNNNNNNNNINVDLTDGILYSYLIVCNVCIE